MPTSTFIEIPDFSGTSKKSGVLQDTNQINYPLVRFQDESVTTLLSSVSGSYSDGQIVGTTMTFNSVAEDNGWGGAIGGASLNVNNAILASDTLSLLLFSKEVTVTNNGNLSGLSLANDQADSYVGTIVFANALSLSSRTLFSANNINLKYVCDAAAKNLYGFLVLHSSSGRTLSAARIATQLKITKS